jgi:hypothetical protein
MVEQRGRSVRAKQLSNKLQTEVISKETARKETRSIANMGNCRD